MVTYRLQHFPEVCAHCLKADPGTNTFLPVSSYHDVLGCTIEQKCVELGRAAKANDKCAIGENSNVPCKICPTCFDALVGFHQYQRKLECVRKFSNGLVSLVNGNPMELIELYASEGSFLVQLLKHLDICMEREVNVTLDKLVEDIPSFYVFRSNQRWDHNKVHEQVTNMPNTSHHDPGSGSTRNHLTGTAMLGEVNATTIHPCLNLARDSSLPGGIKRQDSVRVHAQVTNLPNTSHHDPGPGSTRNHLTGAAMLGEVNSTTIHPCLNLARDSSLVSGIKREGSVTQESIGAGLQPSLKCNPSPGMDMKSSFTQPNHIAGNGQSSSMHHFANLVGIPLEKRFGQDDRMESFLQNQYDTGSEEDSATGNAQGRKGKSKSKKRRGQVAKSLKKLSEAERALRKFPCADCLMSFKTGYHLKRHRATIHEEQRFPCTVCHTSYGRREKLRAHLELVHQIQSYFVCEICLASYESADLLQRHMYRHQHPKPLECPTCLTSDARLANGSLLVDHNCITYQDSYQCCGKVFGFHYYYNRHMLSAHDMKTNVRVKLPKGTLLSQFRALHSSKIS